MRVKHLRVQNFTSLVDVDLRDLPNLVVFIGKNSSGKSNLIDALALLFFEFGADAQRELGTAEEFEHLFPGHNIKRDHAPRISATVDLTLDEWESLASAGGGTPSQRAGISLVLTRRLVIENGIARWESDEVAVGDGELDGEGEPKPQGLILPPETEGGPRPTVSLDEFRSRLAELLRSGLQVIHTTDNPRDWPNRFSPRPSIIDFQDVENLWNLSQSTGNQRQPWAGITRQYQGIAPNQQRPAGVASSIHIEEGSLTVPLGMTGEGSQAVLRLIDQLERGSPIMAIEEPETHLHPALVKRIGQLLGETATKGKQLFISTHSPFLIEQSSLGSFYVVKQEGQGTHVSPMNDIDGLRELLLDIGIRPSDILFSDAILLVEGLSDEMFFNDISNKIDAPLAERHVKFVRANGYPRGRRKIEFWAEVGRDSGLPLYLILDKDAAGEAQAAIDAGQVPAERCLILQEGCLEDEYPWRILKDVLAERFDKLVDEPIPAGERVKQLGKLLCSEGPGNAWKPVVAEEVAKKMTAGDADEHMPELAEFLRRMHRAMAPT